MANITCNFRMKTLYFNKLIQKFFPLEIYMHINICCILIDIQSLRSMEVQSRRTRDIHLTGLTKLKPHKCLRYQKKHTLSTNC